MRNTRTRTLALVVVAILCLALPAMAREKPAEPRTAGDRVERPISLQEIVSSLFERLRAVITGTPPGNDDQTPGSSMDPDGNRPDTR